MLLVYICKLLFLESVQIVEIERKKLTFSINTCFIKNDKIPALSGSKCVGPAVSVTRLLVVSSVVVVDVVGPDVVVVGSNVGNCT